MVTAARRRGAFPWAFAPQASPLGSDFIVVIVMFRIALVKVKPLIFSRSLSFQAVAALFSVSVLVQE